MPFRFVRVVGLGLALFTLGCASPVGPDKKSTPAPQGLKVMIDLPATLTPTTVTASSTARATMGPPSTFFGYLLIQQGTSLVKTFASVGALYGVLFDAVIAQNSLTPSADTRTGIPFTITQDFLDRFHAALSDGLENTSALPAVGTSMTVPDFVYNTSPNSHFTYVVNMPMGSDTMRFFWDADHKRFGMSQDNGTTTTFTMAYDSVTNSGALDLIMSGEYKFQFRGDPASTTHGVFAQVGFGTTAGTLTHTILGYGDDNGGIARMTNTSTSDVYTEEFNGSCQINYQAGTGIPTWGSGADPNYLAKLANTDFGDAPSFFVP